MIKGYTAFACIFFTIKGYTAFACMFYNTRLYSICLYIVFIDPVASGTHSRTPPVTWPSKCLIQVCSNNSVLT